MSLQFYLGGSGSGKSTKLQEDIIRYSMEQPDKQFIFLVPDQFTMQTQKEMVERHPAKGIMNIDILSFGRLAYRIFEEVGKKEQIALDDTGKNLILRKIAGQMQEELPVLGRSLKKTGYIHEIKSVISELMQYGMGEKEVQQLIDCCKDRPALSGKLRDVQRIYKAFLDYLEEKYITKEGTMELLAAAIPSSDWMKDSVVVLDGFTGFTPVQNRVLEQVLRMAEKVMVAVTMEQDEKTQGEEMHLFSLSSKTISSLERLAKQNNIAKLPDVWMQEKPAFRFKDAPMLSHLQQHVFRYPTASYAGENTGEISLFFADSPREELAVVCRKIKELVKEKKMAYRDIAVITGDLERYSPYAAELFGLYEIPSFVDANRKLVLNPFTEFVKSGLGVVNQNFSYDSMMHFLRSGFTGIAKEDIDELENYILALGIRGQKNWERMFVRYPDYMKNHLEALEKINGVREQVMGLIAPLILLKKEKRAEKLVEGLYQFIVGGKAYEKLQSYQTMFREAGDYAGEKEYGQIYNYFMNLLEQIASLLAGEEMSLSEFIQVLEAGISEISVGILPQEVDYVLLGDMERTRLKDIKVLFFVGVNDGIVPAGGAGGGMISDIDREFLRESGFELAPSPRQKMYIQRMYLYMNMTKPTRQLFVSYSKMNAEGKSIRPSYLMEHMRQMFPGILVEDTSKESTLEKIAGQKDAVSYFASLFRDYAQNCVKKEEKELFYALYREFGQQNPCLVESLSEAAFYRYQPTTLPREITRMLYGMVLENSISKMEQFARCAYAHFLDYGMELKEREDFVFGSLDMGNVFHQVLELFGRKLAEEKKNWRSITDDEAKMILKASLEAVAAEYGESILFQNARTAYQISRLERILFRAVTNIRYQLRKGKFTPKNVEITFRSEIDPHKWKVGLREEEKSYIRGKIDRVDELEEDGVLYVKVVDYKSKEKKVDLVELYHGLQLQLVVYLEQAVEKEKKRYPEKEVKPAALFYYPLVDPFMEQDRKEEEEKVEEWLHKKLRSSGLIVDDDTVVNGLDAEFTDSSDVAVMERKKDGSWKSASDVISGEELTTITTYVDRKIAEITAKIRNGEKAAAPCKEETCSYCHYREVCNFDATIPGYQKQKTEKLSKKEVLEKMKSLITE